MNTEIVGQLARARRDDALLQAAAARQARLAGRPARGGRVRLATALTAGGEHLVAPGGSLERGAEEGRDGAGV